MSSLNETYLNFVNLTNKTKPEFCKYPAINEFPSDFVPFDENSFASKRFKSF